MATFIKKLQDYAKQQPSPKETLDINQTIGEIIPIAQRLLGRKISLEFLPSDALPQTFELFSPTHESGLRLPTMYAIVKQLGGYIDVESWQGHGSRFEIYLPESRASAFSLRFFHVGFWFCFSDSFYSHFLLAWRRWAYTARIFWPVNT
jgi:hypothetical protein